MRLREARHVVLVAFAWVAGLTVTGAARAEDFSFSVPVEVHAIPPKYSGICVYCQVYSTDAPSAPSPPTPDRVAFGRSGNERLVNGSYRGTLNVRFDVNEPGRRIEEAKGYQCFLKLLPVTGGEVLAATYPHKPGTPYSDLVRGSLHR